MDETRGRPGMTHEEAITAAAGAAHAITNASYGRPMPSWEEIGENSREHYREQARAAIAAFLAHVEVSEGMREAGRDPVWDFSPDYAPIEADNRGDHPDSAESIATRTFRAMLAQLAREIAGG